MNLIFTLILGLLLLVLLSWGFRYLPGERWQFLAAVPLYKKKNGQWRCVNFTYYGFFIATSQLFSLLLALCLLGSIGADFVGVAISISALLFFCIPAARIMAIIVEKKHHTFTIGGASFVGIILAPWIILLTQYGMGFIDSEINLPVLPIMAALSIAYTMGEGLGRLACLSYGCCYGKPINQLKPFLQKIFSHGNTIFHGENKKVAYESNLCGIPLVPIQAITGVIYSLGTVVGTHCFLTSHFTVALLFTVALTQLWRIISETMRADFRGFGKISTYQKMGFVGVVYMVIIVFLLPVISTNINPVIANGIAALWQPSTIIILQLLWVLFFVVFGKSTISTSILQFGLIRKNI